MQALTETEIASALPKERHSEDRYVHRAKIAKSQTNWLIFEQPILFSLRLAAFLSRREKNGQPRNQCQLGFYISSQQHGKFQRSL